MSTAPRTLELGRAGGFMIMIEEVVLAKAFCVIAIMMRPGARNAM